MLVLARAGVRNDEVWIIRQLKWITVLSRIFLASTRLSEALDLCGYVVHTNRPWGVSSTGTILNIDIRLGKFLLLLLCSGFISIQLSVFKILFRSRQLGRDRLPRSVLYLK